MHHWQHNRKQNQAHQHRANQHQSRFNLADTAFQCQVTFFCQLFGNPLHGCVTAAAAFLSGRAFADWKGEQKWKFVNEDGSCKADEWFTDEAGKTYYIDRDGYMVMGWHQEEDGTWYFFDGKGVLVKGLAVIDGLSYYFLEDGSLFEGERLIGGQRFRFSKDGTSYPQEMTDYGACYSSDGILIREQGQYDKDNPGHYLPFLVLFLMAAAMGWYGKRAGQGQEMVFIFAAVLLSSTPLLVRFMPPGHDLTFHLNRILGVEESLKAGMIPVRINGFSFNGYGYPDPVFYPQLFLYVPAVLHGLGENHGK